MKYIFGTPLLGLIFALGACGDHLGSYRVDDVRLVHEFPVAKDGFDDIADIASHYPNFIRVAVSSSFNLSKADTGAGLYTDADFCPLNNAQIVAFEPRASDGGFVDGWRRKSALTADPRDGLFHYYVYIAQAAPPRRIVTNPTEMYAAYDLKTGNRPVCFRFMVPGYTIGGSKSDIVVISADALSKANTSH